MRNYELWLGNETSRKESLNILANVQIELSNSSEFDPTDYGLLDNVNGVGIVNVVGALVTNAHPAYASRGVLGYNVLKDTLVAAAQDPEIKHILLNVDSPGGAAVGIDSVASLIKKISAEHKPVTAFSSGQMCSAAMWLSSAADTVSATRLSTCGSVGVVCVLTEITKQLEQDGITATVIKSGSKKAQGNPYEVLTPEAKADIQANLDVLYGEFITAISINRGLPKATADTWANGISFLGFQALEVGLIDKVTNTEDLMSGLVKKVSASSKSAGKVKMSEEDMAKKILLDEQAVAILAAGGTPPVQMGALDVIEDVAKVVEKVAEVIVEVIEDIKEEPEVVVKSDMMSYFKAELAEANEKAMALTMENREMKTKLETIDVTHTQLRAIATDAINLRNVGLGRGRIELGTASDEVILSTYSNISKEFNNTFPVGGLTAVASTERETYTMTAAQRAANQATKF